MSNHLLSENELLRAELQSLRDFVNDLLGRNEALKFAAALGLSGALCARIAADR